MGVKRFLKRDAAVSSTVSCRKYGEEEKEKGRDEERKVLGSGNDTEEENLGVKRFLAKKKKSEYSAVSESESCGVHGVDEEGEKIGMSKGRFWGLAVTQRRKIWE